MTFKLLVRTLLICTAMAVTVPAMASEPEGQKAADPLGEYLLNFFDRNAEAEAYASHCLQSPDPAVTARFGTNSGVVAQALLNRAADANPQQTASAIKTELKQRQQQKRYEGELAFMRQGCGSPGAAVFREHYGKVSSMSAAEMESTIYGHALTQTP